MKWPNDAFQTADSEDVTVDREVVGRKERRGEAVGRERRGSGRKDYRRDESVFICPINLKNA